MNKLEADREDVERAVYLLRTAAKFIRRHAPDRMFMYDEAMCDGECLANDCDIAVAELEPPSVAALSKGQS